MYRYTLYKHTLVSSGAALLLQGADRERERERDLLVSSPQLSLQSGGLLVDFRLVVRPAALKRRRFTSLPAHDRQSSEEI